MRIHVILLSIFILFFVSSCGSEQGPAAKKNSAQKVKLALNWFPEAEHGGFYAAQLHDYFKIENLDVDIQKGGPSAPVVQKVATGQVEFAVANADDVLSARAMGADVVAIMAPIQINPRCIMVRKNSNVKKFDDLQNMTLAMSARPSFSHYLKAKFPFKNLRIVPYPPSINTFINEKNFAQQAYNISEPFLAEKNGVPVHVMMVSDTGFNPYCSVLITKESTIKQKPELVKKMVKASIKGWEQYLKSPNTTHQHISSINELMPMDILNFGAEKLKTMVWNDDAKKNGLGTMSKKRWTQLHQQLIEAKVLKEGKLDPSEAFTTQFMTSNKP